MQDELSNEGRPEVDEEPKDHLLPSSSRISQDVVRSPPPPSCSSSMTHPSTHHELSQLALQPAAGLNESAVASQFAQLFVLVSQLKEETEAQRSSIARLSSENTSLKQEVALLKRNERNQDSVVAEISRMGVPQGHWIYEEGVRGREDVEGIWSWSLEKYKVAPSRNVASGPPTSLLSLPVELLSLVLDLLETKEHLVLSLVSFRLLELSSDFIYGSRVSLDPVQAYDFVESRVFQSSPKSERITSLLLPSERVRLHGSLTIDSFQQLVELASALPSPPSPLPVLVLSLEFGHSHDLTRWTDLIRFLNPAQFQLWGGFGDGSDIPPTVRFVPLDFVTSFTSLWTRLECFSSFGPDSVLLLEGTESTSAFEACLRRGCTSRVPQAQLWRRALDGTRRTEWVPLEEIPSFLARPFASNGEEDLVAFYLVMERRREKARVGGEGVGSAEGAVVQ